MEKGIELKDNELSKVNGGGICYYKVKEGDTIKSIAAFLGLNESTLISFNNINNPDFLIAGTTLKYPA